MLVDNICSFKHPTNGAILSIKRVPISNGFMLYFTQDKERILESLAHISITNLDIEVEQVSRYASTLGYDIGHTYPIFRDDMDYMLTNTHSTVYYFDTYVVDMTVMRQSNGIQIILTIKPDNKNIKVTLDKSLKISEVNGIDIQLLGNNYTMLFYKLEQMYPQINRHRLCQKHIFE